MNSFPELDHPVFRIVAEAALGMQCPVFVIGGWVRDKMLGREVKDIDFVIAGSGIELAERVAAAIGKGTKVTVFKNFGTAMIKAWNMDLEFVGARKESYRSDSRKPLVENGSILDDQNRRDFTINAMAISLNKEDYGSLTDPFNGINDLDNKIIKTPLDPSITFSDDPLRMLRAIRFASQLGFSIEAATLTAISKQKERIGIISTERISEELNKIIQSQLPSTAFRYLSQTGLLRLILPQLDALRGVDVIEKISHKDNFDHTLLVLDKVALASDNIWLRWAALLHDIAKPVTKRFVQGTGWTFYGHEVRGASMVKDIFTKLKLPANEKMKYVQKIVMLHLRPAALAEDDISDSAIRRLLFEAGDDIDDLMLLCEADITSKNQAKVNRFMRNFEIVRYKLKEIEEKDRIRNWQPPISGELIMETFNLPPCREVGIIKNIIREAILDGIITNNFDEAFALMLIEGKKIGLLQKKID